MFQTVKRIIDWCGEFKGKLYAGFVMTFFSHIFTAMPLALAAYTIGLLIESVQNGTSFDTSWIWKSILIQVGLVFFRFLFDYFRARLQEPIGYQLTARDRLAVGDALKRVSLGYFQQVSTGNILNSITTGLSTLEGMGIRMIDNFVGGYLNFLVIFLALLICSPVTSLIAFAAAALSFAFLMVISHYSHKNAPVEAQANQDMTGAIIEYARGLAVVKSFGKTGAAMDSVKQAIHDSKKIHLKIEWGYVPGNALHLMALKCGSVGLAMASALMCLSGQMDFSMALLFLFFSFSIFASLEPISDSAHTLGVIEDAMNQLDALKGEHFIDADGADIPLQHYDIQFEQVQFGYEAKRPILKDVSFRIPEKTSTAIVGPSGSGKTTICSLLARFYDPQSGSISVGGHRLQEFTCDSLLSNISMVFQSVYLFHDTIRANICFGKPDATEAEMIAAAKKACCHDFIQALPNGYDTIVGEGGGTLSGGEKQRISIARAILKNAPIIILDEATASIDPENEHLIQAAISELTRGKTIITIAHRLATIQHADQILVVDDGRIAEAGTHAELMQKNGLYRRFTEIREKAEGWQIAAE
ncbi:aBC transporter permease/ATP-binding protein [Ruminococcus sp. CAG:403]|nr:aBC transporter permease/ATP-binding protein [Ruminococcus sp. CAG:403]